MFRKMERPFRLLSQFSSANSTSKIPARPFLGGALIAKEREIGDGVAAEVKKIFEEK
jgi:phage gpG-like protein